MPGCAKMMKPFLAVSQPGGIAGSVQIFFFPWKNSRIVHGLVAVELGKRERQASGPEELNTMPGGETYRSSKRSAGQCPQKYSDGPQKRTGSRMNGRTPAPATAGLLKALFPIALLAALTVSGATCVRVHAESANSDYRQGQNAEAREDYDAAFDD